jgi:hypothetical protein
MDGLESAYGAPVVHFDVGDASSAREVSFDAIFATDPLPTERYRTAFIELLLACPSPRLIVVNAALVSSLGPRQAQSLELLGLTGTAKVALPSTCFPRARTITANDAKLSIVAKNVPAVERLTLMVGSKRELREVSALAKVWALQIGPIDDAGVAELSSLSLEILIARRGRLADLSALRRYPKLTEFGAILCQELRDLSPLADVPALTDLTLHDCAHLEKVDSLLALPNLQRAMIWGCRDPHGDLLRVVRTLRERGVEVLSELDA